VSIVGLTLEDLDLILDLFQFGVALSGVLLLCMISLAFEDRGFVPQLGKGFLIHPHFFLCGVQRVF
jgi:hypothetical protein